LHLARPQQEGLPSPLLSPRLLPSAPPWPLAPTAVTMVNTRFGLMGTSAVGGTVPTVTGVEGAYWGQYLGRAPSSPTLQQRQMQPNQMIFPMSSSHDSRYAAAVAYPVTSSPSTPAATVPVQASNGSASLPASSFSAPGLHIGVAVPRSASPISTPAQGPSSVPVWSSVVRTLAPPPVPQYCAVVKEQPRWVARQYQQPAEQQSPQVNKSSAQQQWPQPSSSLPVWSSVTRSLSLPSDGQSNGASA